LEYYADVYDKYKLAFNIKFMNEKIFFRVSNFDESRIGKFTNKQYKEYIFRHYLVIKIIQETQRILNEKWEKDKTI
jgi:hypothetical protein